MIRSEKATLRYFDHDREVFACKEVDLTVHDGEFLGILGPSGSGKSSLLYMLSGLKMPSSGEVHYQNQTISSMGDDQRSELRLRDFGFIFQFPHLLDYLTAIENVLVARPDEYRVEEARELLDNLDLGSKSHRYPYELSGGERQRVCVARALLGEPKVIFADEPTASLDHANGVQVVQLLNRFRGQGAMVMVTHDPSMLVHADRVVTLTEGKVHASQTS